MKLQRKKRKSVVTVDKIPGAGPIIGVQVVEIPAPDNKLEITVLDINDSGMGITCTSPLKVGHHIQFDDTKEDWDLPEQGIVMWTFKSTYHFRAGIKFI